MLLYISIFFVTLISYLATYKNDEQSRRWIIGMMVFLALFVGLADMLGGYDRYIYGVLFDSLCFRDEPWKAFMPPTKIYEFYGSEFGYCALNYAITFVTNNRYIFIFIVTVIIYALICRSLMRYTGNYPFAVMVFMGLWFFFTFTYLRQVLAASIGWMAFEYAARRKPWHFFAVVLLAFSFHNSALVLLPMYFVPIKKFNSSSVIVILIGCALVGATNIAGMAFSGYGEVSGDIIRAEGYVEQAEEGAIRFEYVLEAVVFLTFIFLRYDDIDEGDELQVTMSNAAIIFCAMLLLFLRSENGGRISWFYMIGIISTITYLATNRRDFSMYNLALVGLFFGLFMRILIQWGNLTILYPYKTFLTNGAPAGWVPGVYEYDHRYDEDKFYKW